MGSLNFHICIVITTDELMRPGQAKLKQWRYLVLSRSGIVVTTPDSLNRRFKQLAFVVSNIRELEFQLCMSKCPNRAIEMDRGERSNLVEKSGNAY